MDYNGFLNAICDDGIAAALADYRRDDQGDKRDGSVQGFEDARATVDIDDLKAVLLAARRDTQDARNREDKRYWFWRCRELEIEWAANVVSAARQELFHDTVIVQPTYRGLMKAIDILGVKR